MSNVRKLEALKSNLTGAERLQMFHRLNIAECWQYFIQGTLTVGGRITVRLTSCLTGLELAI